MPSFYTSSSQFLSDKKVLLRQNLNDPGGTTDMVWRWHEKEGEGKMRMKRAKAKR